MLLILVTSMAVLPPAAVRGQGTDHRGEVAAKLPDAVLRARNWILGQQRDDGWLSDSREDNALAALALLESGLSPKDDRFRRLLGRLLSVTGDRTRFVAMRAEVLVRSLPRLGGGGRKAVETTLKQDLATLVARRRKDGVWYERKNRNPRMEATFQAYQTLLLCQVAGYKVPAECLQAPVAMLLRSQKDDGAWSGHPWDNPNGGNHRPAITQAMVCLAQWGDDGCACRGKPTKLQTALRSALDRVIKHHEIRNCYNDWAMDDNRVRDWNFHRQGYLLGRLLHSVPLDTLGEVGLSERWHLKVLKKQHDDGHWETPRFDQDRHQDLLATSGSLYLMAQLAKPALVCELVAEPEKAHLGNRGLWAAIERLSLRGPQPMRYDRGRLGFDWERFRDVPLVWLKATSSFRLADAERRDLRRVAGGGGTILVQLDCGDRLAKEAVARELKAIWPSLDLAVLQRSHPVWGTRATVTQRLIVHGLDDGVRTFAFVFQSNLECDLAQGAGARPVAYQLFGNLVSHALEGRLELGLIFQRRVEKTPLAAGKKPMVGIGLLKPATPPAGLLMPYDGWALATAMLTEAKLPVKVLGPKALSPADERLRFCDIAYLPCDEKVRLSDEEVVSLKLWLASGGFLVMDNRRGDVKADRTAKRLIASLGLSTVAAKGSPLMTGRFPHGAKGFAIEGLPIREHGTLQPRATTDLRLLMLDGKPVGLYSPLDLVVSASGIRCWGLRGYAPEDARRILANLILSASERL
jgi:Domain of unknown function (DUF4159)